MALIRCRNCGTTVSDSAERCPHCGAPVSGEKKQRECEYCGAAIPDGANVCPNCGAPVSDERTQRSQQQTVSVSFRDSFTEEAPVATPPPRKSNSGKWIAFFLVAVCVIGIVIFARHVNEGKTKTAVNDTDTAAVVSPATAQSEQQAQTTQPKEPEKNQEEAVATPAATQETQSAKQSKSSATVSSPTGTINGHGYVDLGLSVKWATCNVGANSPEEYGDYFAWGETKTKSSYTEGNSKTYGKNLGSIAGNSSYDAARSNWGGTWRLPTKSEFDELEDKCKRSWTTIGGHAGYKMTGPNGNSIFLPAAGFRDRTSLYHAGEDIFYWSATPSEEITQFAYELLFDGDDFVQGWYNRNFGMSVRPVAD